MSAFVQQSITSPAGMTDVADGNETEKNMEQKQLQLMKEIMVATETHLQMLSQMDDNIFDMLVDELQLASLKQLKQAIKGLAPNNKQSKTVENDNKNNDDENHGQDEKQIDSLADHDHNINDNESAWSTASTHATAKNENTNVTAVDNNVAELNFDNIQKYLNNKIKSISSMDFRLSHGNDDDDESNGKICICNSSKEHKIAAMVEIDQSRENRYDMLKSIEEEHDEAKIIGRGFYIIDKNNGIGKFDIVGDEYYVTLFKLSQEAKEKHMLICDRILFFGDRLYFKNGTLSSNE